MTVGLDPVLLRTIPSAMKAGIMSGEFGVYGSVIRSVADGRIVAHLQETGGFARLAASLFVPGAPQMEAAKFASQVAGDALLYEQGKRIKAAVDLLSQQQMANLLLSGATVGISVVGFAVLSTRIFR